MLAIPAVSRSGIGRGADAALGLERNAGGRGAGGRPTASAIVADLASVALDALRDRPDLDPAVVDEVSREDIEASGARTAADALRAMKATYGGESPEELLAVIEMARATQPTPGKGLGMAASAAGACRGERRGAAERAVGG